MSLYIISKFKTINFFKRYKCLLLIFITRKIFFIDRSVKMVYNMSMGRKKLYSDEDTLGKLLTTFYKTGFGGTSITDLTEATGLLRGSLYSTFGSKLGMFLETLKYSITKSDDKTLKLVIIATLELASYNDEVKKLVIDYMKTNKINQEMLGIEILKIGKIIGD